MNRNYIMLTILMFFKQTNGDYMDSNEPSFQVNCPNFREVDNGTFRIEISKSLDYTAVVHVTCNNGFNLDGPRKIYCIDGEWSETEHPQCSARCKKPPFINNGEVQIEGKGDENNTYRNGVMAVYSCGDGFILIPPESKYRLCEEGIWSGETGVCKPFKCKRPENITNGFVDLNNNNVNYFESGYKVQYWCKPGYFNRGPNEQVCQGVVWLPQPGPKCVKPGDNSEQLSCAAIQPVSQATTTVISGFQTKEIAISGTVLEIKCLPRYINIKAPCEAGRLTCRNGFWRGALPKCLPAKECSSPPIVEYAVPFYIGSGTYEVEKLRRYPIDSRISYQCKNGFELEGSDILTCSISGCWTPKELPRCRNMEQYYLDVNGGVPVLVSLATGAGVLLLLVVVCLVVMCRRRKSMSRTVSIQPPPLMPRPDLADHATLLQHPDRLALIAFAEGIQNGQATLPTYEEATRERQSSFASRRFQRPQLSSFVGRRIRNCAHVEYEDVRPSIVPFNGGGGGGGNSTRSNADPMGSTDTMAVSENSTTVTLDTASSHSGSQPASCRAHCGSLASFDTNSVLNTEGVPLLEENELEEVNDTSETMSLAMENRSMADNNSFKYSTSPDMV